MCDSGSRQFVLANDYVTVKRVTGRHKLVNHHMLEGYYCFIRCLFSKRKLRSITEIRSPSPGQLKTQLAGATGWTYHSIGTGGLHFSSFCMLMWSM